jgi:hypothetical protein
MKSITIAIMAAAMMAATPSAAENSFGCEAPSEPRTYNGCVECVGVLTNETVPGRGLSLDREHDSLGYYKLADHLFNEYPMQDDPNRHGYYEDSCLVSRFITLSCTVGHWCYVRGQTGGSYYGRPIEPDQLAAFQYVTAPLLQSADLGITPTALPPPPPGSGRSVRFHIHQPLGRYCTAAQLAANAYETCRVDPAQWRK